MGNLWAHLTAFVRTVWYSFAMKRILLAAIAVAALSTACSTESEPVAVSTTQSTTTTTTVVAPVSTPDETTTVEPTTTTQEAVAQNGARTGPVMYIETCNAFIEFFKASKEFAPGYDADAAAEQMLTNIQSGELSGEADELKWKQMSAADKAYFAQGLRAAASGEC